MQKTLTPVFILVALLSPSAAIGQVISTDYGISERTWAFSKASPGTDRIIFAWTPTLSVFDAVQFLVGECNRTDSSDEPTGKHKVIFKNILLSGVDSGNSFEVSSISRRIKKGLQRGRLSGISRFRCRLRLRQTRSFLSWGTSKSPRRWHHGTY